MSGAFARFVTENRLTHPAQAYHKKVDDEKDLENGLPPGAAAAQQPRLQRRRRAAALACATFACVHMCVHTRARTDDSHVKQLHMRMQQPLVLRMHIHVPCAMCHVPFAM